MLRVLETKAAAADAAIAVTSAAKQHGFIRLPYSVHRSAYGWIPIPVASTKNGKGPRILLMAGNHGDEYEGQVALGKFIRSLKPAEVRGRMIILPSANFPAAMAGMHTSPLAEGNLNRSFPGDPYGGPTAQIADYIETVLLPQSDFVFDFHSGPGAPAPQRNRCTPPRKGSNLCPQDVSNSGKPRSPTLGASKRFGQTAPRDPSWNGLPSSALENLLR